MCSPVTCVVLRRALCFDSGGVALGQNHAPAERGRRRGGLSSSSFGAAGEEEKKRRQIFRRKGRQAGRQASRPMHSSHFSPSLIPCAYGCHVMSDRPSPLFPPSCLSSFRVCYALVRWPTQLLDRAGAVSWKLYLRFDQWRGVRRTGNIFLLSTDLLTICCQPFFLSLLSRPSFSVVFLSLPFW